MLAQRGWMVISLLRGHNSFTPKRIASLTFTWESASTNCSLIHYNIISDCGICPNTTAINEATCILAGSQLRRSCSFALRNVLCHNTFSNESDPIIVDLFTELSGAAIKFCY